MKKQYFSNLDALRFLAFLGVFLYHHNYLFSNVFRKHDQLRILFDQGESAVSFFFVLSGFLITYLLLFEKNASSKINLRAFFLKRALRIIPLYGLIIGIGFYFLPWLISITGNGLYSVNEGILPYLLFSANFDQIHILSGRH